jgi:hypothetical protein
VSLPIGVVPVSEHFLAPWCTEDDIPASRAARAPDVSMPEVIDAATALLYVLSGRQFHSGRSVVRPTSILSGYSYQSYLYPYSSMSGYGSAWGFASGWAWTAIGMGWWQSGEDSSELVLQAPVQKINSVMVDGLVLDPSQYTLYDRRRLVRNIDASGQTSGAWPWQQNLSLPITSPGTWVVDYEWGQVPPSPCKFACIELASEMAAVLSDADTGKLGLGARVLSVATQGVTMAVGDALTFLRESFTALPMVDLMLVAYNPGKLRRRTAFAAPNTVVLRET